MHLPNISKHTSHMPLGRRKHAGQIRQHRIQEDLAMMCIGIVQQRRVGAIGPAHMLQEALEWTL